MRLWKRLTREERLEASSALWNEPPEVVVGTALAAIVKARHMRPQAARALTEAERARALASILEPGETLAASLLVALHLGARRPMLTAFLDAAGLPHDNGVLKEDPSVPAPPISPETAEKAVRALGAGFPADAIRVYLNTLWLQDPGRWDALTRAAEWLGPTA